jgi:hypothetical protein
MKKIFINYSWKHDTKNAEKVYATLTSFPKKFDVWMDKKSLEGGLEWRPAIRKAIREADFFIAVLSPGSVKKRGVTNIELYEAIDVLKEFPPDQVYIVPARTNQCKSPFEQLAKLNYVDLFPNWDEGMEKLVKTIDKTITLKKETESSIGKSKVIAKNYHYAVGFVDLDNELKNLKKTIKQLNKIQGYFLFTQPEMTPMNNTIQEFNSIENFNVSKVPKSYIKKNFHQDTDFIACLTKYPLAFEEDESILYNYFSGPSDYDERFMFLSSDQLKAFSQIAETKFEEGVIYMLISQLINYFTKTDFHDEIRGCVMDFCETRSDIVKGFKKRKLCNQCNKNFPEGDFKNAITSLLKWNFE